MIEAEPGARRLIMSATMLLEFVSRAMFLSSFLCLDSEPSPEGDILSAIMLFETVRRRETTDADH